MANGAKAYLFASALYRLADAARDAITNAPDSTRREQLAQIEAMIRTEIRTAHLPSADEPRVFVKGE